MKRKKHWLLSVLLVSLGILAYKTDEDFVDTYKLLKHRNQFSRYLTYEFQREAEREKELKGILTRLPSVMRHPTEETLGEISILTADDTTSVKKMMNLIHTDNWHMGGWNKEYEGLQTSIEIFKENDKIRTLLTKRLQRIYRAYYTSHLTQTDCWSGIHIYEMKKQMGTDSVYYGHFTYPDNNSKFNLTINDISYSYSPDHLYSLPISDTISIAFQIVKLTSTGFDTLTAFHSMALDNGHWTQINAYTK